MGLMDSDGSKSGCPVAISSKKTYFLKLDVDFTKFDQNIGGLNNMAKAQYRLKTISLHGGLCIWVCDTVLAVFLELFHPV